MDFVGAAHGWGDGGGGQKSPSLNLSHISCNDETWHSYTLPKEHPKNMHTLWVLLTSALIHWKSASFVISRNTDID